MEAERCVRARFRGDWRAATTHAESIGTMHSQPARASRNAQYFVCLFVCCLRECVCVWNYSGDRWPQILSLRDACWSALAQPTI